MVSFDMDFETTREIKAKALGSTTIMMENVFRYMKPSYKSKEGI